MTLSTLSTKLWGNISPHKPTFGIRLSMITVMAFCCLWASSQSITRLELGTRIDFNERWVDGTNTDDGSGFQGQYVRLRVDGTIMPDVKFVYRQRFNKANNGTTFFDTIDFLKIMYTKGALTYTFGKDDVFMGNFENDRAAYDVYFYSDVWRQFVNKQFGASIGLKLGHWGDMLELQVQQSPFCKSDLNTSGSVNMYGYNLRYRLSRGIYQGMYSVNLFEYLPSRYINYICLGNRIETPNFTLEVDLVNRATKHQRYLFRDWSLVTNAIVKCNDYLNVTAKYSYDINNTFNPSDFYVLKGTDMHMLSGGVEIYPFKSRDLRIHVLGGYFFGSSPDLGYHHNHEMNLMAGCTWIIDFYKMCHMERYFAK